MFKGWLVYISDIQDVKCTVQATGIAYCIPSLVSKLESSAMIGRVKNKGSKQTDQNYLLI